MSLAIDVDRVIAVLLPDGWHEANQFTLDAYEYVQYERDDEDRQFQTVLLGEQPSGPVSAVGFSFYNLQGQRLAGPLTSILAVKIRTGRK